MASNAPRKPQEQTFNQLVIMEIKVQMTRQGLTQGKLAERLGWSSSRLNRLLMGHMKLTLDDLRHIADVLGVPVNELGFLIDERRPVRRVS
jgi:transcriptional regulator with XRE-family HTH domain